MTGIQVHRPAGLAQAHPAFEDSARVTARQEHPMQEGSSGTQENHTYAHPQGRAKDQLPDPRPRIARGNAAEHRNSYRASPQLKGSSNTAWEYRQLVIPLDIWVAGANYPTRRQLEEFHGYDGVVLKYLGHAAQDDWQSDEPGDWDSLIAAERFTTDVEPSAEEDGTSVTIYLSVSIRLKRLAPRDRMNSSPDASEPT